MNPAIRKERIGVRELKEAVQNQQLLRGHKAADLILAGRPCPAKVYLATLAPGGGRRAAGYQLRQVAEILVGRRDPAAIPWHRVDRTEVIAILEALRRQGKAISTVNHCLAVVKGVAREATEMGIIPQERLHRILRVKTVRGAGLPAGRAPSREEVAQAIEAALASPLLRDLRDAAILATLAGSGVRCFELTGLTWGDYQEGRLIVRGKGGRLARQPLSPTGRGVLEEYRAALPSPTTPLFPRWRRYDTPAGEGVTPSGIRHILQRWMPGVSPHDLRRGYATWLAADGHGLPVVQRLMRHADPSTTMRYIRNEEDLISASESLRW